MFVLVTHVPEGPWYCPSAQEHVLHDSGSLHTTFSPSDVAAEKQDLRRWAADVHGRDRSAAAAAAAAVSGSILRRRRSFRDVATSKRGTYGWDCAPNEVCSVLVLETWISDDISDCMSQVACVRVPKDASLRRAGKNRFLLSDGLLRGCEGAPHTPTPGSVRSCRDALPAESRSAACPSRACHNGDKQSRPQAAN